ncbi:FAD-dependent oxidoreductase [Nannocystis sp. ILAH1]|uniref:FAD/NAD(P)-binding protein n=1 Tax=unclassified Nannocystis TaxID=2627009 RepID=UPI002270BEA3|nr:FAD-dependent oxidoreductase [Nannocystis sp. ILAH1]MCY1069516.1 FAD-dependent oxidoreductase [Nannocystis sp. RBIL2]
MPSASAPAVVVVGAGFCGAAVAWHLARAGGPRVTLVDGRGEFGPGLAYRTADPRHLLNTPAGRMSALADDPEHFVRWARARDPSACGGSFLPRGVYGDYLRQLVAAAGSGITCLSGHVVDIAPPGPAGPATLTLADCTRLAAEHVVLALGNLPPRLPAGLDDRVRADPRYVHDPWTAPGPAIAQDSAVLVFGTGLSALDLALGLAGAGHRGPVHLLSRHGLLPQAHRAPARPPEPHPPAYADWPATTRGALHALRTAARNEAARGGDWRDLLADLRPVTQAIWRRWPACERERFVRHLRVYWEAHRHRAAPTTAAAIAELRASGRLHVHAGRIEDMSLGTDAIAAAIRPRGAATRVHLRVEALLNATGPAPDPRDCDDPLLRALIARGLLVPDPLGASVADDGAIIDADGQASSWLHAVGGLRRPQLWETTAVLELAPQCQALAERLRGQT